MSTCVDCGHPALAACTRCLTCLLVWHGLQSDPESIAPAPVAPPSKIWDGVRMAIKTPESEGGE